MFPAPPCGWSGVPTTAVVNDIVGTGPRLHSRVINARCKKRSRSWDGGVEESFKIVLIAVQSPEKLDGTLHLEDHGALAFQYCVNVS